MKMEREAIRRLRERSAAGMEMREAVWRTTGKDEFHCCPASAICKHHTLLIATYASRVSGSIQIGLELVGQAAHFTRPEAQ